MYGPSLQGRDQYFWKREDGWAGFYLRRVITEWYLETGVNGANSKTKKVPRLIADVDDQIFCVGKICRSARKSESRLGPSFASI
jgi:hypothetical protein